jgi:hypothetical protein
MIYIQRRGTTSFGAVRERRREQLDTKLKDRP